MTKSLFAANLWAAYLLAAYLLSALLVGPFAPPAFAGAELAGAVSSDAESSDLVFDQTPAGAITGAARIAVLVWIGAFGAATGSFLNVVIYRVPAGQSIVAPGSRCPACGHPIRARDNVPILSWLLLAGKCRDCGAKISPRYPLVELAVAVLFVAVAMADLVPAARLTAREFTAFGLHAALCASLFAVALAVGDGPAASPRATLAILAPVTIAAVVLNAAWPALRELLWGPLDAALTPWQSLATVAALAFGAGAWFPATKRAVARHDRFAAAWSLCAVIAVLGPRVAGFLVALAAAAYFLVVLAARTMPRFRAATLTMTVCMLTATTVVVPPIQAEFQTRPYDGTLAVWIVIAALLAMTFHQVTKPVAPVSPS